MKFFLKFVLLFVVVALALPFSSAAHYIVGVVNDSLDERSANDLDVLLWNPANGISDNLTDTIGVNGNSGTSNFYLLDCEALSTPCGIGDTINVKVSSYPFSETVSVIITGAGYDAEPDITVNSLPTTSLSYPVDYGNISEDTVDFNCSFSDLDSNIQNVSLYGNWSGGWHLNETKDVSGVSGSVVFSKSLENGVYKWGCFAQDNLSVGFYSENNFTLNVDLTPPTINSVLVNETYLCGDSNFVRIICNTTDNFGINRVVIEAENPFSSKTNYSGAFLSGDEYYYDILLDKLGEWKFQCISFDYANNSVNLSSSNVRVYSNLPDLNFYFDINFSNYFPIEGESVVVSSIVLNNGCSDADNFIVGFYDGDPSFGNQIGENQTISVSSLSNNSVNISWDAEVGPTNFFVSADVEDFIEESNETNNELNKTLNVGAWQNFYGNVSGMRVLSSNFFSNLTFWNITSKINGNVFMTDMESDINWSALLAIGRDKFGSVSSDDFSEVDSFLGTSEFNDSITNVFTDNGNPYLTKNFSIDNKTIYDVAVVNSVEGSSFYTGILWDGSDDSDGEYAGLDKEDIVFVSELNKSGLGAYGTYDYELRIPVNLRNYDSADTSDVYLYYDLV